ncbi:MAG: (Fe-S)-binding protein [Candidatus Lokiarchaeota archaeon]|nr:(Fe-S)-binding protein [Candidatus Lokiarchaeota archaeon]
MFNFESFYASGRIKISQALEQGKLEWSEDLLLPIFACPLCGNCEIQCQAPHQDIIVDLMEELRRRAVDEIGPLPSHLRFRNSVEKNHNPYGEPHADRITAESLNLREKADLVYFIGCTSTYREQQIRDATLLILEKADVEFTVVDEYCCGSPLLRTGQMDLIEFLVHHNIDAFKKAGATRILTSCAGCYRTLSTDYPNLGFELPEVLHITELLSELLQDGEIKLRSDIEPRTVTFHDPCHLGRHCGEYDSPRDVLGCLPVDFVEMEANRENAWCCGAGGGVKAGFNDFALWSAEQRIQHAKDVEADILASSCPFCKRNLSDAKREGDPEVMDLAELIERMLA